MESVVNVGVVLVAAVAMACLEYLHMRWIKRNGGDAEMKAAA